MTPDLLALATDVDRLFRARQDGRQMPEGKRERVGDDGRMGWTPAPSEDRAAALACIIEAGWECGLADGPISSSLKSWFRSRRHVSMLALTEPAHFAACLKAIYDPRLSRPGLRLKVVQRWKGGIENCWARPIDYPPSKAVADVARTAVYLAELQDRLRLYLEAEAVNKADAAREDEERRHREDMERTEALVDIDGDVLAAIV